MRIHSKSAKTAVRIGLVVLYFVIAALMFVFGRTHTVLVDNKTVGDVKGIDGCAVSFDGEKPIEFFAGDRDKISLRGQNHDVTITFFSGEDEVTASFQIPLFQDTVLVSIPSIAAGKDGVEPFDLYGSN